MTFTEAKVRHGKLVEELRRHDYAYYVLAQPTISDRDYDRLYHELLDLEKQFSTLFQLDYSLVLYDLTSTYFEGLAVENELAQRGYSRDHRGDCKQVVVALVVLYLVIERIIGQSSGQSRFDWRPEGVVCDIKLRA